MILIKVFCNRFEDAKSADRNQALELLLNGQLPIRLKMLAYLDLQSGFIPFPDGIEDILGLFDWQVEERLLREILSPGQECIARQVYNAYKQKLNKILNRYPCYPAIPLVHMATQLPDFEGLLEA